MVEKRTAEQEMLPSNINSTRLPENAAKISNIFNAVKTQQKNIKKALNSG